MPSLLLCCGNTHRQEPSALETGERGVCSHFLVCERVPSRAGSAACGRQQGRGKAPMQDAFAVRRMTCCSAFAANKNWHKILSGRQTPSLLLCCGNTHRRELSARPRQASEAYVHFPMCVKEFLRAQVRRLAGGVCLSDATTKKRRPRQKAEDLILTMRPDGRQVKIAYAAEPCCQ